MTSELPGHGASAPREVNTGVEAQLDKAAEEVARRFGERVDHDVVRQAIGDAYGRLARRSRFVGFLPPVDARSDWQDAEHRPVA
ncbi:hypothetical protein [Saccharothrix yanglingensis]|uniref:hypothetical protein n=1 Tax=Saccharothrix yanglingensis TaxID=659496 RepID=UPI0027D276CB|nr:hypothetical protein [Saccharothrix yanglingensis]